MRCGWDGTHLRDGHLHLLPISVSFSLLAFLKNLYRMDFQGISGGDAFIVDLPLITLAQQHSMCRKF